MAKLQIKALTAILYGFGTIQTESHIRYKPIAKPNPYIISAIVTDKHPLFPCTASTTLSLTTCEIVEQA
jgi:hypothetical protein|tara:strand:+ start:556 stop:762 length:207 start_codon:yes stop_codon:yes gene_type:complete